MRRKKEERGREGERERGRGRKREKGRTSKATRFSVFSTSIHTST